MSDTANKDIERCTEEILNTLNETTNNTVDKEEIEKEIKKFIEYGVPLDHAKQTLLKKYGGEPQIEPNQSSERVLIVDLQPNQPNTHIIGKIININPKQITVKGEDRTIHYGLIGDESGTVSFTAWNEPEFEKDDVVEITNAYTKEWQGAVQLNIGDRTHITKTDKSKLSDHDFSPREYKIKDLRTGLGPIDIKIRIIEINEREVTVEGNKKKVFSGIIGDETGKAQYTSWHDFKFKEGDVIHIVGGYIKSWKGIPQLTFDEKATVKKISNNKIPKEAIKTKKIPLHELVERNGALDIEIQGTIIDIRPGSGLIKRCPECNRALYDDECQVHGKVKGVEDLRLKVMIDDGSGSISAIIGREQTEQLLGKTLEEWKKTDEITDEIGQMLFAHRLNLKGNALGDTYGITMIVKEANFSDFDINEETEKLKTELEELK